MPTRSPFVLAVALVLIAGPGGAENVPLDPHICIAPVPAGPTGGSDFGRSTNTEDPQFIPGYPTPIFRRRHGGATYLTAEHRLMSTEPGFGPGFVPRGYLGRDGDVYYWYQGRDRQPRLVFDRTLGYFRVLRADETDRQAEVDRLVAEVDGYEHAHEGPSVLKSGRVFPLGERRAKADTNRPGYWGEPWSIDSPSSGLLVEADGDTLRLSRSGRTVQHTIPAVAWGNWYLTELPRSGRALLSGGRSQRLLLIDADLTLTRPAGDWRVGSNPQVLYLPQTGEALITTSDALYWLRDRRLSGPEICGDTAPPPPQPISLLPLPGAQLLAKHPGPDGYLPVRDGAAVLFTTHTGLFELGEDKVVRRIPGTPEAWFSKAYPIPGTDDLLINGCDSFVVFDGTRILHDSDTVDDTNCTLDLQPLARNPATGTILLEGGWRIVGRELRQPDVPLRPVATPAWLDAPLLGFSLWGADDGLVPYAPDLDALYQDWTWAHGSDVQDFWIDAPRFEFLIGTRYRSGFVRFGRDLALTPMPGQPERYADFAYNPIDVTFDPGAGAMLAGTRWDLLAITAEGTMHRVPCRTGCDYGWVAAIAPDPETAAGALVGTEAGLFRYDAAEGAIAPLLPVERTGSVYALTPAPWLGFTLVEAGFGTFTWSPRHGLRRIEGKAGARRPPHLAVIPEARRILTEASGAPDLAVFPADE